jgi:hypothetical protein
MAKSKKTFRPAQRESDKYYRAVMLDTELAPGGQARVAAAVLPRVAAFRAPLGPMPAKPLKHSR